MQINLSSGDRIFDLQIELLLEFELQILFRDRIFDIEIQIRSVD